MRSAPKLTLYLSLLASAAVLGGCALSVDSGLIRQDAGDEADDSDAGEQVFESDAGTGDEPDDDAGAPDRGPDAALDAESPNRGPDAALDAGPAVEDAGPAVEDATVEPDSNARDAALADVEPTPQPFLCTRDVECAAAEYCAFKECPSSGCYRTCQPRCGARGCAGTSANGQNVTGMAASGETLFWSTPPDRDTLGNVLNGGRNWSWRHSTPTAAPVERESGELLLAADDYLYFLRPVSLGAAPTVLFRKSLSAQDAPATQLATDVLRVWKTPGHVVWSRKDGSSEELWRLSRTSTAAAERVAVTQAGHWSSSNATFAIKALPFTTPENYPRVRFAVIRLSDQMEVGSVEGGFAANETSQADEDYFYFQYNNEVRRAPFANLSQQLILARSMEVGVASLEFELDGSWLYWEAWFPDNAGRSQRDLMVNPPERLVASGNRTTRIKNVLFYYDDGHIFYQTMTQLPCAAAMACPADMTCSAGMVCE